ncbi:superoxide dismutase [Candidatus Azambacteria bacterium]|nr:superoxide dismutase [Candidatus Azambacteria bacterium]
MPYEAKKFEHVVGMQGFSDQLLKDHFTLYQGYVTNFNKLDETLMGMEKAGVFGTPEFAELNRRLGWEFNGMRLHELYFDNLTKEPRKIDEKSALYAAIVKEFGSYDMWEKDFVSMGAMRGIGWVVLYHDVAAERLFNVWVNEHDVGHMAGAVPLLVMDVFEHAYIRDYGIARKEYVAKFMANIDWAAVERRYSQAS